MDDIACFLCSNGPGSVGLTPDYDPVPKLPPEPQRRLYPAILPLRSQVLDAVRRGGAFRCRPNELGQWNIEPGVYHHLPEAHGPQHPGAEAVLLQLESEGRIERAGYWGPKSLEHFAPATFWTWRATHHGWLKRTEAALWHHHAHAERKFTRKLRQRAGLVRGRIR